MIQIIYVTDTGREIAQLLLNELPESHLLPAKAFVSNTFSRNDALIFIGAMGVCLRTIAPFMKSKKTDPDVICVDSAGNYVISVLSGRIGGANKLTRRIARILGSLPIITTESDNEGFWGLDTLAPHFGWQEEHRNGRMNHIIFHFVSGRPTVLKLDVRGSRGVEYLKRTMPAHVELYDAETEVEADILLLAVSPFWNPTVQQFSKSVLYRPQVLHLGIECIRECPAGELPRKIRDLLHQHNLSEKSIDTIDTTAQRADEMLIQSLLMAFPWAKLCVHELEENNTNICEACANSYGPLLMEKQELDDVCAVSVSISREAQLGGHIEFVGAGPGDPDLVSVRGMQFLQQADLILYSPDMVSERLTHYAKKGCTVRSTDNMKPKDILPLMKKYYKKGLQIVHLLPGDPTLSPILAAEKSLLEKENMRYHITPGITCTSKDS
ncbi:MAG: cobalamin biosynthesis protein [Bacteroidaceae bacterium]|nr:cobalamin biosynthesis protein [Bacteroidaceae bacterium]